MTGITGQISCDLLTLSIQVQNLGRFGVAEYTGSHELHHVSPSSFDIVRCHVLGNFHRFGPKTVRYLVGISMSQHLAWTFCSGSACSEIRLDSMYRNGDAVRSGSHRLLCSIQPGPP